MIYLSEKVATRRRVLMTGMLVSSALVSPSAIAGNLPSGGSFAAGAGTIAVTGNHMTVHQSGGRAIVNWDSFSIAASGSVAFDNGSGATLNRVTGSQMSSIAGSLTGTGSVYLINPQGVAVEAGGKVVVGGSFVASSLDVPDSQFMAGGALRFKGDGRGSVTNAGSITSTYGDVLLIGATVSNEGKLSAPRGTAGLAGGTDILVNGQTAQGGRVFVEVAGSGSVTNTGDVQGAMAELQAAGGNVYALAGNNGGQIRATGVGTRDGKVWLTASGGSVINAASVSAVRADGTGGVVSISAAQLVSNTGTVAAEGTEGGAVSVAAANVINQGKVSATGSDRGGAVSIAASSSYLDTGSSKLAADGGSGQAGSIAIGGTGTGFSSGTISARSDSGQGGDISVTTATAVLVDAHLDASGGAGGGKIRVGGTDFHGGAGARSSATTVSATTTLKADATHSGSGGSVVVWSDKTTSYAGAISASGKTGAGKAEVSSGGKLAFAGTARLDAANGALGELLLDPKFITISNSAGAIGTKLLDPREGAGANAFGAITLALASGNMVVTAPGDSAGGANAGAVYVFNSTTGALVSALTGSQAGDQVGLTGVTALTGGNFVVRSANWNAARGAVTFGSGTAGISGVVSSANSLVGGTANDQVGATGITTSSAGYVVRSNNWNGTMGAVSFGTLTAGVSGVVSSANSLVGSTVGDQVGSTGVTALSNGNFIVLSPNWNGKRGAATLIDSTVGLSGVVSASNSLVGSAVNDRVGAAAIALSNGNVIIRNPFWTGNIGAATWMSGTAGLTGAVSSANSLVGSIAGDQVGSGGFALTGNGNAIITSANWNAKRGAVTWINGATGLTGAVTSANSLVGSSVNDAVGSTAVALGNGNAVIGSANWSGGFGAATWINGAAGLVGAVSSSNSLVGSSITDKIGATITALKNNDYLVRSATWNGNRGAVTWGSGTSGVVSVVSSANSLVGSTAGDQVGLTGVTLLANGSYVVGSANWNGTAGAATFGAAGAGVSGTVSAANSLVGSLAGDKVGSAVTALANSSYVVSSPTWNGNMGAATFGATGTGVSGTVSASNSLVGSTAGDKIGTAVTALANSGYVVSSTFWNGNMGAATFGATGTGVSGVVSATNSLVGSTAGDQVGSVVVGLSNSAYVVGSAGWNGNRGAATYGGTTGISGTVSQSNSLVGSTAGDQVGSGITGIGVNYIVRSPNWNGGMGAATWIGSATNTTGTVSAANSLVGSTAGDQVGSAVTVVGNTYVVSSALWNGGRGAVTWAGGSTGISGVVSASNSLVGSTANAGLAYAGASGNLIFARSSTDGGSGRVYSYNAGSGPTTFGASPSSSSTISTATLNNLLSQRSNVTLQANDDITVASAISVTGSTGGTLTLDAGRSLYINADITTGNGGLTLIANERLSAGVVDAERDPGAAGITMAAGTQINAGTGAVSINLRDGLGRTNLTGGDITLGRITAGAVTINNQKGGIVFNDSVSSRNGIIAAANGGDLTLQSGSSLTAAGTGDAIRLATTGQFTNNAGGLALSAANGRWLVYTADLPKVTAGGLSASPLYGRAFNYGNLASNTVANRGNRFVYGAAKTLTVTGDAKSVVYNGATQLDSYTISGLVGSDLAANAYSGAATITGVKNAGGYNITPGRGTLTSDYGYTFAFKVGRFTVTPYILTWSVDDTSSIYGTLASKGAVTTSAPFSGDVLRPTVSVYNANGTAITLGARTAAGLYSERVTSLGNGNYALATSGNRVGTITINKKALTWSVANATSTYGTLAGLGAVTLTGVVTGDTVRSTVGLFDRSGISTALTNRTNAGTYSESVTAINNSNYYLAGAGNSPGTLVINPRTITVGSIGGVSAIYGNQLLPGAVTLQNLVSGDKVGTSIAFFDANGSAVTGRIPVGQYREIVIGLDNSNYRLAATGNSTGIAEITPRSISVLQIGNVTTPYGVLASPGQATLSGVLSGDQVTGLVSLWNGSGATVTQDLALSPGRYREVVDALGGTDARNYMIAPSGNAEGIFEILVPRLGADPTIIPVIQLPEAISVDSLGDALVRANRLVASSDSAAGSPDSQRQAGADRQLLPGDGDTAESWFANGRSHVIYQIGSGFTKDRGPALAGISSFEEAFLEPNASVLYIRPEDLVPQSQNDSAR